MSLIKYGLEYLSLRMDPDTPEWLHDTLNSLSSMKGLSKIIIEWDDIITHAIGSSERRLARVEMDE